MNNPLETELDEQIAQEAPQEIRSSLRWLTYAYMGLALCAAGILHVAVPRPLAGVGVLLLGSGLLLLGAWKSWHGVAWAWNRQRANRRAAEDAADMEWWYDELTPEDRMLYEHEHGKPDFLT